MNEIFSVDVNMAICIELFVHIISANILFYAYDQLLTSNGDFQRKDTQMMAFFLHLCMIAMES